MSEPLREALDELLANYLATNGPDGYPQPMPQAWRTVRDYLATTAHTLDLDSPETPGRRSAALWEAWVTHGGDRYFGPLFWDQVVARFDRVQALIEGHTLDLDSPETVERLARALERTSHIEIVHGGYEPAAAAILAALREQR